MCGIVAIYDTDPAAYAGNAETGQRMLQRIRHRGPDGMGSRQVGPAWLGHVRLAIVDVNEGDQPIAGPDGAWIVANGEIYNHDEVRASTDYPFVTDSDSEAALAAALSGELDALAHLRGMYAFAVADDAGGFQLVRDPLGVKPLYWAHVGTAVYAASELRAFDEDVRALVTEFPPGFRWTPRQGLQRTRELHVEGPMLTDRAEAVSLIRDTLCDCVERRLMADVPVGVFLSGGLDSSLVAAVMAWVYDGSHGPLHSFAAGTAGSSDLVAARRVADHLGFEHHEITYTSDDVVTVLPEVVRCIESYEPSLVRSAVPNYLLARETARTVKVVLTGEGADELFAGYAHHRDYETPDELRDALVEGISGLHNLNLQRADRTSMAHGLEARVPFLDRDLVNLAARIPAEWKVADAHGEEKALLRDAFDGWLPHDLLWRPKEQFGDGSGTADVMLDRVQDLVPEDDWQELSVPGLPQPRSREELAYQRVFATHLAGIDHGVLGRFATE